MNKLIDKYVKLAALWGNMDSAIISEFRQDPPKFPSILRSEALQKSVQISSEVNKVINQIAKRIWSNDKVLNQKVHFQEYSSRFSDLIVTQMLQLEKEYTVEKLPEQLKHNINRSLSSLFVIESEPLEHVFPTRWILKPNTGIAKLGSIQVEYKSTWLERMFQEKRIDKVALTRIPKIWNGDKLARRKASQADTSEDAVIGIVGNFDFILSVTTNNCLGEAAALRADRAFKIFLTSVSLLWESPERILNGLSLGSDTSTNIERKLVLRNNVIVSNSLGIINMPFSHPLKESWQSIFMTYLDFFSGVEEILNFVVDPNYQSNRQVLLGNAQAALRWFYEGCKSNDALMSTTHFASCLDALGNGKGARGIEQLIKKQLGLSSQDQYVNNLTVNDCITKIYSNARSEFLHGSSKTSFSDWTEMSAISEYIAHGCLYSCLANLKTDSSLHSFK